MYRSERCDYIVSFKFGNTKEIINLETSAKKHNIKSIGISQFGTNYLAKNADIPLHTVKPKEAELRSALLQALYMLNLW